MKRIIILFFTIYSFQMLISPTYPTGRIYNSLGMNGTNQYVEVINDPNINFAGNITVSAWVNMNAVVRDQKIAGNQNNTSGGYKFGIYTNNKVEFEIRNAANTPSLNRDEPGGTVLSTGQWYFLAGISSDVLDSIETFVNGIPERPGYAINFGAANATNTVDITGVVNNGSLSVTLYNHNNTYTKGFNLLGNPYPSPIDWYASSGRIKTNIDDALYFFRTIATDQYGGYYSSLVKGISSDGLVSNIISTMQGFFVHITDGNYPVTGIVQMNNNVRVINQSQSFIKGAEEKSLLRLSASFSNNLSSPDLCVVYFDPKATSNEFDGQLDALKLMNTDLSVPNVYIVTPGGTKISIKALPYATDNVYTVPLGLKINKPGVIIFKINDMAGTFSEMSVSLLDKVTGTVQNLLNNQEYRISLGIGEYLNRFYLNLSNSITEIPDNFTEPDLFSIYYSKEVLKANISSLQGGEGSLMLCNILGQILFLHEVHGEGYHEFSINLKDGIYIATFISGTKTSSKKIIIHTQ